MVSKSFNDSTTSKFYELVVIDIIKLLSALKATTPEADVKIVGGKLLKTQTLLINSQRNILVLF